MHTTQDQEPAINTSGIDTIENALAVAFSERSLKKAERTLAVRQLLYDHRAQLFLFVQQNGGSIPSALYRSELQPAPGVQPAVDRAADPAPGHPELFSKEAEQKPAHPEPQKQAAAS